MFPPPDFESDYVCRKHLILLRLFTIFLCMCKRLCKFGVFRTASGAFRKAAGRLYEYPFSVAGSIRQFWAHFAGSIWCFECEIST
jgi:hypothetical protein